MSDSKKTFEKKGLLFIITGASGVGKGTVHNALMQRNINLHKSISVTTRKPRSGETHGVEYFFCDGEQFEDMLSQGKFLEHAKVYGNCYGTLRETVLQNLNQNKDTLLEIDLDGARQIKSQFGDEAVWIFIMPPDLDTLVERLNQRNTDDEATKKLRLSLYDAELRQGKLADFVIVNDNLQSCVNSVVQIILDKRQQVGKPSIG